MVGPKGSVRKDTGSQPGSHQIYTHSCALQNKPSLSHLCLISFFFLDGGSVVSSK